MKSLKKENAKDDEQRKEGCFCFKPRNLKVTFNSLKDKITCDKDSTGALHIGVPHADVLHTRVLNTDALHTGALYTGVPHRGVPHTRVPLTGSLHTGVLRTHVLHSQTLHTQVLHTGVLHTGELTVMLSYAKLLYLFDISCSFRFENMTNDNMQPHLEPPCCTAAGDTCLHEDS